MRNKAASITLFTGFFFILSPSGVTQAFSGADSGTEQDPYIITNVYELQQINSELDACYELANDIDASGIRYWNDKAIFIPIGD
ncbi:MAG: hypothetical protein WBC22_11470 [Sedimentisphaerales bacterium]